MSHDQNPDQQPNASKPAYLQALVEENPVQYLWAYQAGEELGKAYQNALDGGSTAKADEYKKLYYEKIAEYQGRSDDGQAASDCYSGWLEGVESVSKARSR